MPLEDCCKIHIQPTTNGGAAKAVAYGPSGELLAVGYHNGQIVLYHMTEANMGEVGIGGNRG